MPFLIQLYGGTADGQVLTFPSEPAAELCYNDVWYERAGDVPPQAPCGPEQIEDGIKFKGHAALPAMPRYAMRGMKLLLPA